MNCFDRTRRLLKKSDYDHVFEQVNKIVTPEFIVFHCVNSLGHARLGIALAKKTIPKAHNRNRIKRLLRETFRTTRLPAVDVIFLARRGVAEIDNTTIIAKLSTLWNKIIAIYAT